MSNLTSIKGLNASSEIRPPTENLGSFPTARPTSISLGKREKNLLKYMLSHEDERFNRRGYSRLTHIAPSTIADMINRLIVKGLVKKESIGNPVLTQDGKNYLNITNQDKKSGVGRLRMGERGRDNLSLHKTKFKLPILCKKNFDELKIKSLNLTNYKKTKLQNLETHYLYYNDVTIVIQPKQVLVYIKD